MRKRFYGALLALGMAGAVVAVTPEAASACTVGPSCATSTLTATLTANASGSRFISSVTPGAFSSLLGATTNNISTTLGVVVAEAAVQGDVNGWSVTAQATDFADAASDTISAANLTDGSNGTIQTLSGGTLANNVTPGALNSPATLFANSGQVATQLYTGTYTSSSTMSLAIPNQTVAGVYTSTLTVTLIS